MKSFVTSRPVGVLMVFAAAFVFGYLSLGRLPVTLMPELTYPTLTVRTEYPGAAPEEVENDISRPIEEALGVVAGLRRVSSISRATTSDVVLEFTWDTEMSEATQDVLEKLDLVFLPDDAERPLILHYDPSLDAVLELSLSGTGSRFEGEAGLRRLRRLAELQLKRKLEPIKGVAAVRIRGGLEEEIHVLVEEEALRRTGIPIQTVIRRLAQENINVAGGTLKEGRTEYLIRTLNEYESLDQIGDTIVTTFEGRPVRIRDLGQVVRSHKEREILTRTDGEPSVRIEIYKEGDANIVALAKRVKALVGEFEPPTPEDDTEAADGEAETVVVAHAGGRPGQRGPTGLADEVYRTEGALLSLVADRSLFIESSINEVKKTAILGGLLAILVLFLFLQNFKSTIIIAVSIPISLIITFAPLHLAGVTLNIMSLGGLALGVGMLVDSSIVVLESIYRCREEGDGVIDAANRGAHEVRGAVLASTLTSIAVFLPMVFVEGMAGQAFGDLGIAVVVSLLAAAAVALYLIPMLASREGIQGVGATDRRARFGLLPFWSWQVTVSSFRGWRRLWKPIAMRSSWWLPAMPLLWILQYAWAVIAPVYWSIRLVLGGAIELVGKLLMLVLGLCGMLLGGLFFGLRYVFGALVWLPIRVVQSALAKLQVAYAVVLRAAIARPAIVALIVAVCVGATWQSLTRMDSELLPEVHQSEFTMEVALPVGTPLEGSEEILSPIEQAILEDKDRIRTVLLTIGYDSSDSQRSDEGEHTARFKFLLEPSADPAKTEEAVIARLRARFAGVPDLESRIVRPVLFSSQTPIEVEVHGNDLRKLKQYGDRVEALMAAMPELADVETTLRRGAPEVQVVYDRDRLSRYGLNVRTVAELVRDKVRGTEATRFNLKDRRIPIMVRLAEGDRGNVSDVAATVVNPGGERPISLSAVADVALGEGPSEVRRIDGQRVAVVRANLGEGSLGAATARIRDKLNHEIDWPSGMTFVLGGQEEEWQRSRRSLWIALALSIFLVYVIMAAQFESLIHPLVIMLTIPLAFVGSVLTLKALGLALSIVVFLGMIMLAGIVVNNAIVLVDYINKLRERGLERDEAILTAGSVRLRPILMTTATTVLGLTPMALGLGDGAEIRTPMAIAVISGLISSTVLTLIVIPSIYAAADNLKRWVFGRGRLPAQEASSLGAGSEAVTP